MTARSSRALSWAVSRWGCRLAWALVLALGVGGVMAQQPGDLIGETRIHITDGSETLLEVARDAKLGLIEILAANPGIDPWVPGAETSVLLPTGHLLPDAPREGVVINLAELRLYFFPGRGAPPQTYPIGIGRSGFSTPVGQTRVVHKRVNPTWVPTAATRADRPGLPAAIGPGPDNPLGAFALDLGWPTYAVHGTNKPWGVGRRVSRGCIRLYPEDIEALFGQVAVGTKVTVVDQSVKLGWSGGELYIEVHPDLAQLDQLEAAGAFQHGPLPETAGVIAEKAGAHAQRLDWPVIRSALVERRGIPLRITR